MERRVCRQSFWILFTISIIRAPSKILVKKLMRAIFNWKVLYISNLVLSVKLKIWEDLILKTLLARPATRVLLWSRFHGADHSSQKKWWNFESKVSSFQFLEKGFAKFWMVWEEKILRTGPGREIVTLSLFGKYRFSVRKIDSQSGKLIRLLLFLARCRKCKLFQS